jgi:membrane-associated phospholipid phosphatase
MIDPAGGSSQPFAQLPVQPASFLPRNPVLETLAALDLRIAAWFHSHGTPALTAFMLAVTNLHAQVALCLYAAIFVAWRTRRRDWRWVWAMVIAVPVGLVVNYGLKLAFQRARPHFDDPWVTLHSYSFPSGHTAGAVLLYGVLAAYGLAQTRNTRQRIAIVAATAFMVALVALTRVYLGAHYFSDVIAAVTWALAWVVAVTLATKRIHWKIPAP